MARFSLVLSVVAAFWALATPIASLSSAPPFWMVIQTPTPPSTGHVYITVDGGTTTNRQAAAICYNDPYSKLFIGDFNNPVGLPLPSASSSSTGVLEACKASGCVTTAWKIDPVSLQLYWSVNGANATTWYGVNSGTVFVSVGGARPAEEVVPATLNINFGG